MTVGHSGQDVVVTKSFDMKENFNQIFLINHYFNFLICYLLGGAVGQLVVGTTGHSVVVSIGQAGHAVVVSSASVVGGGFVGQGSGVGHVTSGHVLVIGSSVVVGGIVGQGAKNLHCKFERNFEKKHYHT